MRTSQLLLFFSAVPRIAVKLISEGKLTKTQASNRCFLGFSVGARLREGAPSKHDCLVQFSSVSLQQAPSGRE